MATDVLPDDTDFDTNVDDTHMEIFSLIWLDANVNVKETRNTEQNLRSIINHLKKFQDVEQCQQYIEQRSQTDRLVLIVSGQPGQQIVPSIHKLRQVMSIYVYCMDTKRNKEWTCKFNKVKAVVVEFDELISRIKADHKIQKKVEEPLSINIFTTNAGAGTSTTGVNGQFVFSQILIDCLLRLKSTPEDKNELINFCKKQYKGNSIELNKIREFQEDYLPNQALWWYTRESFFYKTLNAALRTQNIHMIFLFRAFIFDIHRQLEHYQAKSPLRVYRSQMMSSDELKNLKQSLGQFISVNSFFSTSTGCQKAINFLKVSDGSDDLERVLFDIDADPKMVTTKSFANISEHSDFPDESEILFMLGSIFRLQSIDHNDDDQIWIIRMTLCSDDEHDLKQVLMHMKKQIGDGETNLRTLGKVLWEMGKLDLAEKYFMRFLEQLPSDAPLHISLYEDLGKLASQRSDYDKSVQWRQQLLTFKNENPNIIETNNFTDPIISRSTKWKQNGITVAGGNQWGDQLNQLLRPGGVYVDDDHQCIYIADCWNARIVEWKFNEKIGRVVAGGNERGKRIDQLNGPTDMIVDKKNDSLIISDRRNNRVVRWPRRNGRYGETIISHIDCSSLTMDNNGNLYVIDRTKNEVRRWKIGEGNGTVVAGRNGCGPNLNQLNNPTYLFIDQDHSIYVSDCNNHRVVKWIEGAREGMVVAGGHGVGNSSKQLYCPEGVFVDYLGDIYVSDRDNHRIMCWPKGSEEGQIIVGGNGQGNEANQFSCPIGLSFDRQGNLYVVDWNNARVQKFEINLNQLKPKLTHLEKEIDEPPNVSIQQDSASFINESPAVVCSGYDDRRRDNFNAVYEIEATNVVQQQYNDPYSSQRNNYNNQYHNNRGTRGYRGGNNRFGNNRGTCDYRGGNSRYNNNSNEYYEENYENN